MARYRQASLGEWRRRKRGTRKQKGKLFRVQPRRNIKVASVVDTQKVESIGTKKVRCECGQWFYPSEMVAHSYKCSAFHKKWGSKVVDAKYEKKPLKLQASATYNKATGWLALDFPDKPSEEVRTELKQNGFRWRPYRKQWIAKWTAEREDLAKKHAGTIEKVDIKPDYANIAKRARELEEKHIEKADEHHEIADKISSAIPLGQPILVGHHSEKRHRKDLERIRSNLKKSIEEREVAEKYKDKAERYEALAVKGENPVTIYDRIKRLEATERGWMRQLEDADIARKAPKLAERIGISADPKHEDYCRRNLEQVRSALSREREKYKQSGGIPAEHMTIKVGDVLETQHGKVTVLKVNPETIKVEYHDKSLKVFSGQNMPKTSIVKKTSGVAPQKPSMRAKIFRSTIGHYGGAYVEIPAEHWQEFKRHFPKRQLPRDIKKKNIADTLTVAGEGRFNREFPQSKGQYYELHFAHGTKGLQTYDNLVKRRVIDPLEDNPTPPPTF